MTVLAFISLEETNMFTSSGLLRELENQIVHPSADHALSQTRPRQHFTHSFSNNGHIGYHFGPSLEPCTMPERYAAVIPAKIGHAKYYKWIKTERQPSACFMNSMK